MKTKNITNEEKELILKPVNANQLKTLTKSELIELFLCEQKMRIEAFEKRDYLEKASLDLKKNFSATALKNPSIS